MKNNLQRAALSLLAVILLIYLAAWFVPIDPAEQRPGTRLSGSLSNTPPDWSSLQPRQLIYVQTHTWYGIPHSVTTISFVVDGELYVPCARCPSKRWPENVAADPRVRVKVGDQLYPRRAIRVTDPAILAQVFDAEHRRDDVYLYHMTPP